MSVLSMFKREAVIASPNHERLQTARAARAAAQHAIGEARAPLERFYDVVRARDVASRAAENAVLAANEGRQAWVRAGCPFSGTREVQRLDDAAAVAAGAAQRASVDAAAVMKEIPRAEDAVSSAEADLRECEIRIKNAADLILVGEFDIERGERLAAELQAWHIERRGLVDFVTSADAGRLLQAAGERARLKDIPDYVVTGTGSVVSRPPAAVLALTATARARAEELLRETT